MARARAIQQANEELYEAAVVRVTGVKVFSATKARDREALGDLITAWIHLHPECLMIDKIVTQSSDSEYHCLTITLFYRVVSP